MPTAPMLYVPSPASHVSNGFPTQVENSQLDQTLRTWSNQMIHQINNNMERNLLQFQQNLQQRMDETVARLECDFALKADLNDLGLRVDTFRDHVSQLRNV